MGIVQVISICIALLFLFQVFYFTAKNKLQDQQAFLWILIAVIGLLVSLFLPYFNTLAAKFGISYMPSVVFTIAFILILNLIIFQTITISKQQSKIKQLVQEVSFVMRELDEVKKKAVKED